MVDTEIVAQSNVAQRVKYDRDILSSENEHKEEVLDGAFRTFEGLQERADNASLIIRNANKAFDKHLTEVKASKVFEGVSGGDSRPEVLDSQDENIDARGIFKILTEYHEVENIQTYENEVGEIGGVIFSTSEYMYRVDSRDKYLNEVKTFFKEVLSESQGFEYFSPEMVEYLKDKKLDTVEEIMAEIGKNVKDNKAFLYIEDDGDPYKTGGENNLCPKMFLIQSIELGSEGIIQEFIRVAENRIEVEEIGLPVQISKALTRGGIFYAHQLVGMNEETLQKIRGIGPSYSEVVFEALKGLEKEE